MVAGGASANHTLAHIKSTIAEKNFNVKVNDVTKQMGILSIQGRER